MQDLFRLRIEASEALQNQTLTFVDAGEPERECSLAVLVQWQDRALKSPLESLFHDFVRDYRDAGSIVSPGSFLERLVHALDAACGRAEPELLNQFELGVILVCGRGLYILHSTGLEVRQSIGGVLQPLQSSLRVRVKDLSPGGMRQSHLWSDEIVRRLRLLRVFFEDEDGAVLLLGARGETLPAAAGIEAAAAPQLGGRIVVTKEPALGADAVAANAAGDSAWPDLDETPRRDQRTLSYAALALVIVLFGTALFGLWRWQRLGSHALTNSGADASVSEAVDSSLEPRQEEPRVAGEVVDGEMAVAPGDRQGTAARQIKAGPGAEGELRVLWSKHHSNWVTSSPRLAGGRVVYGCRDGRLYAVDPGGKPLWEYDSGAGIGATPAVDDGRVYCGNYGGRAFALKDKNGSEVWTSDLGARLVAGPATGKKFVFFTTQGGEIVALKKKNGEVAWRRQVGGKLRTTPLVRDDDVFVPAGTREFLCLKQSSGETRWSYKAGSEVQSSPLCAADLVIFGCKDGSVYALTPKDGALVWRLRTKGAVQAAPALGKDLVYVASTDRRMYAVRPEKGEVAWTFQAHAAILSSPCVQDGRVYLTAYDRRTYVLDAASGRQLATTRLGAPIFSSPLVYSGRIYCGSNSGTMYCMNDVD